VAVHEIYKRIADPYPQVSLEDGLSDISIGTWSYRSAQMRAFSDQQSNRTLDDLNNLDTLLYGLQGPSVHHLPRTADSDISLSDGSGRLPSDCDSETRSFFLGRIIQPSRFAPGQSQAEVYGQGNGHDDPDTDQASEGLSAGSSDLLLGPQ
jgi:hypothetical protein